MKKFVAKILVFQDRKKRFSRYFVVLFFVHQKKTQYY